MTIADQRRAASKIMSVAECNGWPLICDPTLSFVTPQLKHVHEIWKRKSGERLMPSRSDFSLRDLKEVTTNLALIDVDRDRSARPRLRARLVGTVLDRFLGQAATGRYLEEIVPPKFAEKWFALWLPIIEERAPTRTVGRVEYADRQYFLSEAFRAPLSNDGETVDNLMLVDYFHFAHGGDAISGAIADHLNGELARAQLGTHQTAAQCSTNVRDCGVDCALRSN